MDAELLLKFMGTQRFVEIVAVIVLFFPTIKFLIIVKNFIFKNGKNVNSMSNNWDNPASKENPVRTCYFDGHKWSTKKDLINFSNTSIKSAKKAQLKPLHVADFRIFDKAAEDIRIPKFIRNHQEKTKIFLDTFEFTRSAYVIGGAGTGKTEWLLNIVKQQVFTLEIFYSKKGDFETLFFRNGCDILLNPKLKDGYTHDFLAEELEYIEIFLKSLLNAVLGKGQEDYFKSSAFQRIMQFAQKVKMQEHDNPSITTKKRYQLFIELFQDAVLKAKTGTQKSENDVMSTVTTVFNKALLLISYRMINGGERFVVKDFIRLDNQKQRLFLSATDTSLEALLAASFAVLVKYQLAQTSFLSAPSNFLIAYYLDEFLSLAKVAEDEVISEMSRVGRQFRIAVIKLFQRFPKFDSDDYKEIVSNCQFMVFFPVTEPGSLEEINKQVGNIIFNEIKYVKNKDNVHKTEDRREQAIVTQKMITSLQKENYSHIFFSPKLGILTKAYTPRADIKVKEYVKAILTDYIDSNKFYKFAIETININVEDKQNAKKSLTLDLSDLIGIGSKKPTPTQEKRS
ncbi:MAG: type IV secretion system DNA-binding domain-containing protein [Arcobacteraceae bacterium]|jgi:hypothetical protein|nr:type IV secretion system DNA-binding domain-containing protein [Arcobacteraceae bacterium]